MKLCPECLVKAKASPEDDSKFGRCDKCHKDSVVWEHKESIWDFFGGLKNETKKSQE